MSNKEADLETKVKMKKGEAFPIGPYAPGYNESSALIIFETSGRSRSLPDATPLNGPFHGLFRVVWQHLYLVVFETY